MNPTDAPTARAPAVFDTDFACGGCGYNLRGLSMGGTCSECGHNIRLDLPAGAGLVFHAVKPDAIRRMVKRALFFSVLVGIVMMTTLFGFQLYQFSGYRGLRNPLLLATPLGLILSIALSLGFTRKRLQRLWAGYLLMATDEEVVRRLPPHPPLRIPQATVTKIERTRRGLTVRTADSQRFIVIPAGLEGFAELAQNLEAWMPFVRGRHTAFLVAIRLGAIFGFGAAFYTLIQSSRKPLVLAMAAFVVGWVTWAVWKLFKNPQLSTRMKLTLAATQLAILAWVAYRCWTVFRH